MPILKTVDFTFQASVVTAQSRTSEKMADVPMFSPDDQGNKVETGVEQCNVLHPHFILGIRP